LVIERNRVEIVEFPVYTKVKNSDSRNIFMPQAEEKMFSCYMLLDEPLHFRNYGGKDIEQDAIRQMKFAMRLPVAIQRALLPDAHAGYGLPSAEFSRLKMQ